MSANTDAFKPVLAKLASGTALSEREAEDAFALVISGALPESQVAAFLMALRVRGETVAELAGAARILRAQAVRVDAPAGAIDTCGTGGTDFHTVNISTATAFVLAGCGVSVAKHGNRSRTGAGSAEVLQALGVKIDAGPEAVARCIARAGIGFLFAPLHHGAMKHVAPVRAALGLRTIFNLLGPCTNPAGARRQVLGVFDRTWVEPLAHVLGKLGSERAWVVYGHDGLDELTTTTASTVAELKNGRVRVFEVAPEDAGLSRAPLASLAGGSAEANAAALVDVLDGAAGAFRDIVLLNSAAALVVAECASDLKAGAQVAAQAIADGRARRALATLVAESHR